MNVFGEKIKITIFGESHGGGIGAVIDGLPPGEAIDEGEISGEMLRRAPGGSAISTPRRETDEVEILSGVLGGKTTGAPLCGIIRNQNIRSSDYSPNKPRPGHADLTAYLKYKGFSDYRGGGHFSGRITAPIVFAGAVCKQILKRRGVYIGAHIESIETVFDDRFTGPSAAELKALAQSDFPLLSKSQREKMEKTILNAKAKGDSVGGIVECAAIGVPAGLGSPFFGSMESRISAMMYSIPAVKGVEFGAGFAISRMTGGMANDPIRIENGSIYTETNNNGGILGGITNGMPIIFRVAVKPTPSIALEQRTIDLQSMENATISVSGRHDPCIVPRAVPVVEASLAICLLDAIAIENFNGVDIL